MRTSRIAPTLTAAAILAAALLQALWMLWPAWWAPEQWLIGSWTHPDCLSNHWLLEWVAQTLRDGGSLAHTDAYYWPVGDAPVLAGNGAEGISYLPFRMALGPWPRAVPAWLIFVLSLNGLGGYALGRAAGAGHWAALAPMAAMGFCPYVLEELSAGRFSQVSVGWLLLFLASWLRLLEAPGRGRALLAAALLAITCLFYWFYGFFGVFSGGLLLLARGRRPPVGPLTLFALAFLLLVSPWALFFASGWGKIPGVDELVGGAHPQALADSLLPVLPILRAEGHGVIQVMGAGTWLAGLGGLLLVLRRPVASPVGRGLLLLWLLALALMAGPFAWWSPFSLLYGWLPPLRRFWWPSRHVLLVQAAWATLGALAIHRLGARHRAIAPLLGLGIWASQPLLLRLQGTPDRPYMSELSLPPEGYVLLGELGPGALIELPLTPEVASTQQTLIYQLWHHHPLLGGHALWVARVRPPEWDEYVAHNSFLSQIQRFERGEAGASFGFQPEDLQALRAGGARWISLNREYFVFPLRELVADWPLVLRALFGPETLRTGGLAVWDLDAWNGEAKVEAPEFRWPEGLRPGGPELPITGRRPKSPVFPGGGGNIGP